MDQYFKWYELSEPQKVKLATIKLMGAARLFWTNLEHNEQALGSLVIATWDRMKKRLRNKYVPYFPNRIDRSS